MQFTLLATILLGGLSSLVQAKTTCQPSPKVSPKPQYEFTMNLTLGAGTDTGVNFYNARQKYLPIVGGNLCAKWNGGVTGIVVSGVANYDQTANGTGPYKLNFEYLLRTSDTPPASIVVNQFGWEVNFVGRTTFTFETGDVRYKSINSGVSIGVETGYVLNGTTTYSSVDGYSLA